MVDIDQAFKLGPSNYDLRKRIEKLEVEIAELRKLIPTFDTASPEAVQYGIAFHQSQQKKRKAR